MTRTLVFVSLLLLAASARAEWEGTYRLPRLGGDKESLFKPFVKKWPYFAECGLSREEWQGLHESFLKSFGIAKTRRTRKGDAFVTFDSALSDRHSDAVVRAVYAQWREKRSAEMQAERSHVQNQLERVAGDAAQERQKLANLAARGAAWDRAEAVRETEARMRDLRHRLVDARIEIAVLNARAKAMRAQIVARRKQQDEALKRRIHQLEEELADERKRQPTGENTRIQILEHRLAELREELAFPGDRLINELAALEIDLVGQEELIKQYELRREEEVRRRVQIATSEDLGTIHRRALALAEHAASLRDQTRDLDRAIDELRNLRPKRVDD